MCDDRWRIIILSLLNSKRTVRLRQQKASRQMRRCRRYGGFLECTLEIAWRRRYGREEINLFAPSSASRFRDAGAGATREMHFRVFPRRSPNHLRRIETPQTASTCCTRQIARDDDDDVSDKRRRSRRFHRIWQRKNGRTSDYRESLWSRWN